MTAPATPAAAALPLALLAAALLAACGSAGDPPAAAAEPDAGRAFGHLRALAVGIGVRDAGTAAEREAAAYVAAQLRDAGYEVAVEEFEASFFADRSTLAADGEGPPIAASALRGSPRGEAAGPLVHAGLGTPEEIAAAGLADAIALLDRGQLTFAGKARNAQAAGAVAAVVVNDAPGPLAGTLGEDHGVTIPVVAVEGGLGPALRALAADRAPAAVRSAYGTERVASQNVVGRPPGGGECRAYLGAHYDSAPQGPGANDNASGTALLLELARTRRAGGVCAVAFGAEEAGLLGSRAFVRAHGVAGVRFMLNFDMVGRIGGPRFVAGGGGGGEALAARAAAVAAGLGHDVPVGAFPPGASSDHASFAEAGVPAITVHSGGAEYAHTARDTIDTVSAGDLAVFLEISAALLRSLLDAPPEG